MGMSETTGHTTTSNTPKVLHRKGLKCPRKPIRGPYTDCPALSQEKSTTSSRHPFRQTIPPKGGPETTGVIDKWYLSCCYIDSHHSDFLVTVSVIDVQCGVSKGVVYGRRSPMRAGAPPLKHHEAVSGMARPQIVERSGMAGPHDTLGSPWPPLAICLWYLLSC
jgi:hypothetical protein